MIRFPARRKMISRKIIFPRFMDVEWRDHIRELIPIRHLSNWNSRALLVLIELTNEELVILLADSTSDSIFSPTIPPFSNV